MPTPLARLRHDLDRLVRRRSALRFGTVAATLALVLLAALVVAFAVDFLLDLSPLPRAVALLAIAAGAVALAVSMVRPWLAVKESITDVALDVESRQHGPHDLVAALQFQADTAGSWGSTQLEQAVIGEVDEAGRDLDLFEHFSWNPLPQRLALLGLAVAALVLVVSLAPQHANAFLRRLMLAEAAYPTRTVIASVTLNGSPIDFLDAAPLRIAAGTPLTFAAEIDGVRPAAGSVVLTSDSGPATAIALQVPSTERQPSQSDRQAGEAAPQSAAYVGRFDSLRESLTFVVKAGDAETLPRQIELVPRPTLTMDLLPTPPEYARSNAPSPPPAGVRTAYVLEGSRVAVRIRAVNKPLARVSVTLATAKADRDDESGEHSENPATIVRLKSSPDGKTWTLDPSGTLFENVRRPIAFTVTAIDRDGLTPAESIIGSLRLRTDRVPRVAATVVVRHVLPAARPQLSYGASDDFGLKALRAKLAVTRGDGTVENALVPLPLAGNAMREYQGRHAIDLSKLKLGKGDRVVVTVEAEDDRGTLPGETAAAEPIALEVTDRAGLLTTLLEADEESADRLDAIIRRELGIGEQR